MKEARFAGHVRGVGTFPSILGSFWDMFSRVRCAGIVLDALGSRQFLEHGVQAMFGMRLGHDRDAAWFPSISRQFLGHDVQAMSRLLQGYILIFTYFYTISWTRCPGHVREASWPGQGWSLIFRQFRAIFGHDVPAMSGTPPSQVGMQPDFQAFLGISGKFLGTVYKPRPGRVLVAVGTQPDFQPFVGVQAMSGTRLGRDKDAAWFSGISRQFLGHSVQAMSRMLQGYCMDAA
ncbi:Hypothetical predicted protein [Olea europaea subsp. europaea]|uniref:Uncharacterized protein n=1 Tax=Olea europaea subsp. europaea TaxID=158383 RepID=A0A8S0QRB1_OLEEU|nr:Hypothetical predicted protein [Olea europaea subsp. europaea]